MVDTVQSAIVKMGMDGASYLQTAAAIDQANDQLVTGLTEVAGAEEKVTQVTQRVGNEFAKLEARADRLVMIEQRRANAIAQANRVAEEEGVSAARLATLLTAVNAKYDQQVASYNRLVTPAQEATKVNRNLSATIQNLGFQIGDFAVQVASGGGFLRPLIQQGTQAVSQFGMWGSLIGAGAAVAGAVATAFIGMGSAADEAAKKQEKLKATTDGLNEAMKQLAGTTERTSSSLLAEVRNRVSLAEIETAKVRETIKARKELATLSDSPGAVDITSDRAGGRELAQLNADQLANRAIAGEFDDGRSHYRDFTGTVVPELFRTELQKAQDQLAIARQVAGTSPFKRAGTEAYLTTLDSARHDQDPAVRANAEALARIAAEKAIIAQTRAVADQNREVELNSRLSRETAAAWMESNAAGARAAAAQKAALDALKSPIDAAARAQQILADQTNDAIIAGAKQVRQFEDQARASAAMVEATERGPAAEAAANLNQKIGDATRSLRDALGNATGDAAKRLADEIDRITDAVTNADAAARQAQIGRSLYSQSQSLDTLALQLELVGKNAGEAAVAVARLQAEQYLANNPGATTEQADRYVKNAEAIARMNVELDRQRRIAQVLPDAFDRAFDRIGSGITEALSTGQIEWAKFGDVGRAVLSELIQLAIQLAVINPVKNWLTGGNDPVAGDVFGGILGKAVGFFGSLFGGSSGVNGMGVPFGHAAGGPVSSGDLYMVGERGPELFVSDRAGTIIPNHDLSYSQPAAGAAGGGRNIVINNNISIEGGGGSDDQNNDLAAKMQERLERSMEDFVRKVMVDETRDGGELRKSAMQF